MFYIAIHDITSLELEDVGYLDNSQRYARTLWIKGTDYEGRPMTQRIALFSKTRDGLTMPSEKAQLMHQLDQLVVDVKEGL